MAGLSKAFTLFCIITHVDSVAPSSRCCQSLENGIALEVLLHGGLPNPVLRLNHTSATAMCSMLAAAQPGRHCSNQRVLGFTGWRLSCGLVVHGGPAVHELIMRQPDFEHLASSIQTHIRSEAARLTAACPATVVLMDEREWQPEQDRTTCRYAPIRGPDDPQLVKYDVKGDDEGCFNKDQNKNNW